MFFICSGLYYFNTFLNKIVQMVFDNLTRILPQSFVSVITKRLNSEKLYEIRLRNDKPVTVNYGGDFYYFGPNGIKDIPADSYVCKKGLINEIIVKASEYSLYAVNDQICNGYLTIRGGIRLGIAGEVVSENGVVRTVKNFSSLNIRIPHEVHGCARTALDFILKGGIKSALIISPPGAGKTTILRDIARVLGDDRPVRNILLVDERSEIAACNEGIPQLSVGANTDIISNCAKGFAFSQGVRALRPDIIITDELFGTEDTAAIEYVCASGVTVFASVHAKDHIDIVNKPGFEAVVKKRLFSRYIVLSSRHGPGTLDGVYDENFECIYYA